MPPVSLVSGRRLDGSGQFPADINGSPDCPSLQFFNQASERGFTIGAGGSAGIVRWPSAGSFKQLGQQVDNPVGIGPAMEQVSSAAENFCRIAALGKQ